MKRCSRCGKEKEVNLFYKDKGFRDGYASACKECKNLKAMAWREKNRDQYNQTMKEFRANNREVIKDIDLKRTHGISLEEYNKMLASQDNRCKICRKLNTSSKRSFAVDHNHETGHIRALLCYGCNRALHTLETKNLLEKAKDYLEEYKDPTGKPISKIEFRIKKKESV